MKYPLSQHTKAEILAAIDTALGSGKSYAVEIKLHDNSLKARQRALANIWYIEISGFTGDAVDEVEAYCKYKWGLRLMSQDDPDRIMMLSRMLADINTHEERVELIRVEAIFFPVLRDKGGLSAEKQASYLESMKRHYAEKGCILSSPREKDLLNCRQANTR